jgi:hypothetical protein
MNEKEFTSVLALPPPRRYEYFVKKAADGDTMWSLRDADGWVITVDDDGRPHVPLWPHPDFAEACATAEWKGAEPVAVDVDEWVEGIAGQVERDGLAVAVFPTPEGRGVSVPPARLKADLEDEQSKFLL